MTFNSYSLFKFQTRRNHSFYTLSVSNRNLFSFILTNSAFDKMLQTMPLSSLIIPHLIIQSFDTVFQVFYKATTHTADQIKKQLKHCLK